MSYPLQKWFLKIHNSIDVSPCSFWLIIESIFDDGVRVGYARHNHVLALILCAAAVRKRQVHATA